MSKPSPGKRKGRVHRRQQVSIMGSGNHELNSLNLEAMDSQPIHEPQDDATKDLNSSTVSMTPTLPEQLVYLPSTIPQVLGVTTSSSSSQLTKEEVTNYITIYRYFSHTHMYIYIYIYILLLPMFIYIMTYFTNLCDIVTK